MDIVNSLIKTGNKTANINVKKLQFIHTVNGDGSKTAKIIKKAMLTTHNIDIQAVLVWLTLPFYDFCGFRSVAVNSVYKLQFFTFISCKRCKTQTFLLGNERYRNRILGISRYYAHCPILSQY